MISDNQSICPKCGGQLKYYDHVQRLVRTKFGNKKWVAIRRLRCCKCHAVHRELPDFIFPYKQYEADIITRLFKYGEDFFIGDIVQIANEYGNEGSAYISELVISNSEEGLSIYPTFKTISK